MLGPAVECVLLRASGDPGAWVLSHLFYDEEDLPKDLGVSELELELGSASQPVSLALAQFLFLFETQSRGHHRPPQQQDYLESWWGWGPVPWRPAGPWHLRVAWAGPGSLRLLSSLLCHGRPGKQPPGLGSCRPVATTLFRRRDAAAAVHPLAMGLAERQDQLRKFCPG